MNNYVLSKWFALFLCCLFLQNKCYSQLNESEIKAAYLLNFLDNLTYSNQTNLDSLHIVVLDNDEVYQATYDLAKSKKVDGLYVAVSNHRRKNTQLAYLATTSNATFKDQALKFQQSAVVGDIEHYMVDIRFIKNEDKSISFSINDNNLNNKKIQPSSQLLVYSENKSDVLSLIDQQQAELDELINQSKLLSKELEDKVNEVNTLNEKIKLKEDRLFELNAANSEKSTQLSSMQEQIAAKENELSKINSDYNNQNNELTQLKTRLNENYAEINAIADSLKMLQSSLEQKKKLVKENEELLAQQQKEIEVQGNQLEVSMREATRNRMLLLIAGGFTFILIIVLYYLNKQIKAKRQALITIEKQNIAIQQASKQKDEFISNLSHEVRSPLNAIIGYAELIRNSIRNQETKQNIEYITTSSKNLLGMINDILDYRKIEAGKGKLEYTDFELRSIVDVAFNTLRVTAENKGLEYELEYDATLPQYVHSDSKKINQILINLIGNAIKFTAEGHVYLRVKKLSCTEKKCEVRFCVSDTGIGIDKENQKMIFETFTQETDLTSKEFGGSGLGLSISKKLVELFGGQITIDSEPGKGATFSFTLNLDIAEQKEGSLIVEETVNVEGLENMKILIVDDLLINRNLLLKQFELNGYQDNVSVANNGLEALEMINMFDFDIVITDIRMPGMTGIELTKTLRKNGFKAPIIGLSANNLKSERDECLDIGMNSYIVKPYSFDHVLKEMATLLNLKFDVETMTHNEEKVEEADGFTYSRLKEITETEEEFKKLKEDTLNQVKENITSLKKDLTLEKAHENVNKAGYFGNDEFLNLCRELEAEIRNQNTDKAKQVLSKVEESLQQNT